MSTSVNARKVDASSAIQASIAKIVALASRPPLVDTSSGFRDSRDVDAAVVQRR